MKYELITVSTERGKFTFNAEGAHCRFTYHIKGKPVAYLLLPADGDRMQHALKAAAIMYGRTERNGQIRCTNSGVHEIKDLLEKFLP